LANRDSTNGQPHLGPGTVLVQKPTKWVANGTPGSRTTPLRPVGARPARAVSVAAAAAIYTGGSAAAGAFASTFEACLVVEFTNGSVDVSVPVTTQWGSWE
jgi:hypothetical protein